MKNSRSWNLDILRIVAALMVVTVHIGQQYPNIENYTWVGAYGMECFFIMSGYLIFGSLKRSNSTKEFLVKRAIRIIPMYYIILIINYIVDVVYYHFIIGMEWNSLFFNGGPCSAKYIRYFGFLQLIIPSDDWKLWNNRYALWTISSFVTFYILAPILYKIFQRVKRRFITSFLCLLVIMVIRPFWLKWLGEMLPEYCVIDFVEKTPASTIYCFGIGIVLFFAIQEAKEDIYCFCMGMLLIWSQFTWYKYPIMFLIIVTICIKGKTFLKNVKVEKIISFFSKGSFALYLCHPIIFAIINLLCNLLGIQGIVKAILLYSGILIGTYVFYYFIELPIEKHLTTKLLKRSIYLKRKKD